MDKSKLITVEELLAWRDFDRLRRAWGLREIYPHEGFQGTRPITGCQCFSCIGKSLIKDAGRVERHNRRIEAPYKNEFYRVWLSKHSKKDGCDWNWSKEWTPRRTAELAMSARRATILTDFVETLRKNKDEWSLILTTRLVDLKNKQTLEEKIFLTSLLQIMIQLFSERAERDRQAKEVDELMNAGFDASLRAYVPPIRLASKREWTYIC
jgi:hypothetical protein